MTMPANISKGRSPLHFPLRGKCEIKRRRVLFVMVFIYGSIQKRTKKITAVMRRADASSPSATIIETRSQARSDSDDGGRFGSAAVRAPDASRPKRLPADRSSSGGCSGAFIRQSIAQACTSGTTSRIGRIHPPLDRGGVAERPGGSALGVRRRGRSPHRKGADERGMVRSHDRRASTPRHGRAARRLSRRSDRR